MRHMTRMLLGCTVTLIALSTNADAPSTPGAPVNVQNIPLAVTVGNEPIVNAAQHGAWSVDVSGTPTVIVGNAPSQAIPVTGELVSVPSEPYHVMAYGNISPGQTQPTVWFMVPFGRQLVVEHVSILTAIPSGQAATASVGIPLTPAVRHRLVLSPTGDLGGGLDWLVASQPIRMYANGGAQALFVEIRRSSSSGYGSIEASISGFLVDSP